MRRFRALALTTLTLFAAACQKKPAEEVILIGHVGSLTGSEASFGNSTENGIRLAIEEITVMAKFAREHLKLKRVAILRDVGSDYSVGLADYFKKKFEELGGTIVNDQSFKSGDQDFKAQLTTIRGQSPEMIYIPGYYTEVALAARQARELGIKVPLGGGDGWDSAKLYEIAQGALDGSFFSNHYTDENPDPLIQNFVKRYREKFKETPDSMAALGYDAAHVAFDAMARAKDLSGPAVRDAIAATKGSPGVGGTITIDADHNAVKSAVVLGIVKNKAKFVASVLPL